MARGESVKAEFFTLLLSVLSPRARRHERPPPASAELVAAGKPHWREAEKRKRGEIDEADHRQASLPRLPITRVFAHPLDLGGEIVVSAKKSGESGMDGKPGFSL
jgi:hypothetical protein